MPNALVLYSTLNFNTWTNNNTIRTKVNTKNHKETNEMSSFFFFNDWKTPLHFHNWFFEQSFDLFFSKQLIQMVWNNMQNDGHLRTHTLIVHPFYRFIFSKDADENSLASLYIFHSFRNGNCFFFLDEMWIFKSLSLYPTLFTFNTRICPCWLNIELWISLHFACDFKC